jgi:hypothetical protein
MRTFVPVIEVAAGLLWKSAGFTASLGVAYRPSAVKRAAASKSSLCSVYKCTHDGVGHNIKNTSGHKNQTDKGERYPGLRLQGRDIGTQKRRWWSHAQAFVRGLHPLVFSGGGT